MAIGRLSVTVGKKGKASPHAQYIAREGKYAKPSNHAEKLEYTGHGNMPAWAQSDPNYFWKMADEHERKNGSTYREHVIALPRELDENQRHELVKDWIKNEIGDKHAYQYAIHNPPALDGGEQPHVHLMFSDRLIDGIERDPDQYFKRYNSKNPDKGGAKKANTPKLANERKEELKAMRERWENTCNTHLEKAGSYERISMKSLKEQGITREPLNFSMSQINNPIVNKVYRAELKARSEHLNAETDLHLVLGVLPKIEVERQHRMIEQERIQAQRQENARQAKQALQAEIERERAEQARQAKQALQAEIERERAEQARQQAIEQEKAQAERQRAIAKMTPFELLKISVKTEVHGHYNSKNLTGEMKIGSAFGQVLQASKEGYKVRLGQGDNKHLEGNKTAQNIKDFMYKHITNIDVIVDYGELSIEQFTDKYSIDCELEDLEPLYEPQPQPQQEQNNEHKRNDSELDSNNYPSLD